MYGGEHGVRKILCKEFCEPSTIKNAILTNNKFNKQGLQNLCEKC